MIYRSFKTQQLLILTIVFLSFLTHSVVAQEQSKTEQDNLPNIILVVADDLGYGDLSCYGSKLTNTPNLDRLASRGIRFTNCMSGASVDSAARAAVLTGCYPQRVSITGILSPRSNFGLNPDRETISSLLNSNGYRTAFVGNWHLGTQPDLVPSNYGFESSFFIGHSPEFALTSSPAGGRNVKARNSLPLWEDDKVVDPNPRREKLFERFSRYAIDWLKRDDSKPSFLMLTLHQPHIPLAIPEELDGITGKGKYADVLFQIDRLMGKLDALRDQQASLKNTLIIFTSDNGPRLEFGNHGGNNGPFSHGKYTSFEGGFRVPCIANWPDKIPPGQKCDEMITNMDWLPSIANLIGARLGEDVIDGQNIMALLQGSEKAKSPHEFFFYYRGWNLQAVRSGKWKLHLAHEFLEVTKPGSDGLKGKTQKTEQAMSLFNLESDPGESTDISSQHPETLARLKALAGFARKEFGDMATGSNGRSVEGHKKSEYAIDSEEP